MVMQKKLGIAVVLMAIFIGFAYGLCRFLARYYYPFGCYHRCDKQLWFALRGYAEQHGKEFPSGQTTPEASLSLLGAKYGYLLPRRDVPVEVVQRMLERGQLLGPETCGWNYVEGLRLDSNPELALFWDKEGLSEVGQRLSGGGHIVTFVDAHSEQVPALRWHDFLDEQKDMLAAERARGGGKSEPKGDR